MFKYFFFNLDTRIHTSPKEDGHGSKAHGPGVRGFGTEKGRDEGSKTTVLKRGSLI